MIPKLGCSPRINILTIGAKILEQLKADPIEIDELLLIMPKTLGVSMDHIILTTDWLFSLESINIDDGKVVMNEIN